jgi:hypothetical protein
MKRIIADFSDFENVYFRLRVWELRIFRAVADISLCHLAGSVRRPAGALIAWPNWIKTA